MFDYDEKRRQRAADSALTGAVLLGLVVAFGGVFAAGYFTASMRWALTDVSVEACAAVSEHESWHQKQVSSGVKE